MLVTECLLENSAAPTVCLCAGFPHCLLSFGFSAGADACLALTSSVCKQGLTHAGAGWLLAGSWSWWPLPLDSSRLPGPQSSSPGWDDAHCSQYFLYCSLGCVSGSSDSSWRIYWQEGHRCGVVEGAGRYGVYFQCPGHSPLSSLTSCSAYILWPRIAVFYYPFFNFILCWGWNHLLLRHFLFLHFSSGSEHGTYRYHHHQIPWGKLTGLKIPEASMIIL